MSKLLLLRAPLFVYFLLAIIWGTEASASSFGSNAMRSLEDNPYFEYDLSQFSLRFEKCQYVQMFDDELAEDEESETPLALKHFVVFRLCPTDSCSSSCESGVYGQYVTDVQSFLQYTINGQEEYLKKYCENCDKNCGGNEDNENNNYNMYFDCTCQQVCDQYENLEAYGYVDASEYRECKQLERNGDDDGGYAVYIGPRCATSGNAITIGLFSDEDCFEPIDNVNVEEYLGATLSYILLRHSYEENERVCLSCMEQQDNDGNNNNNQADQNDAADADYVIEMCEDLYNDAAKCESPSGLESGFVNQNRQEGEYENQVESEWMACNFINSLVWNSYTQNGEINVGEPQDEIIRVVTPHQLYSLLGLGLCMLGLGGLMMFFNRKIEEAEQKVTLTSPPASSVMT